MDKHFRCAKKAITWGLKIAKKSSLASGHEKLARKLAQIAQMHWGSNIPMSSSCSLLFGHGKLMQMAHYVEFKQIDTLAIKWCKNGTSLCSDSSSSIASISGIEFGHRKYTNGTIPWGSPYVHDNWPNLAQSMLLEPWTFTLFAGGPQGAAHPALHVADQLVHGLRLAGSSIVRVRIRARRLCCGGGGVDRLNFRDLCSDQI